MVQDALVSSFRAVELEGVNSEIQKEAFEISRLFVAHERGRSGTRCPPA